MKTPLYINFFTATYKPEADELIKTLDAFGLQHDVRQAEDMGDWTLNCGQKPGFIREMMRQHPNRSLVWLDADARVRQAPTLFDELDCDVAFHLRNGRQLLSGTLYFAPTPSAVELLDEWCERCQRQPYRWDQLVLQEAVKAMSGLRISILPASYTLIFDLMKDQGPPVIEHMQASRRLKHLAHA